MTDRRGRGAVAVILALLLLGACLRAPVTVVGPVMDRIGLDTGLEPTTLGLLGALPVLFFGLGSAVVTRPAARFGPEAVIATALLAITGGLVLRSLPVAGSLWVGSAVIGVGIAAGNVLAPAVVKREQPHRIPFVTALFTAVMGIVGALASGVAVPLSDAVGGGGWRRPLAAFAVVSAPVCLLWLVRSRRRSATGATSSRVRPEQSGAGEISRALGEVTRTRTGDGVRRRGASLWRSPGAWLISAFMGLQSSVFYILVTWLPTIEVSLGLDPATAGWHLFVFQVVAMAAGIGFTRLMRRRTDLRALGVTTGVLMLSAMVALYLVPGAAVLWVALAACGAGSSLVLALSLFGLRTVHPAQTAELSAMAQTLGYCLAACGPLVAGWIGSAFAWEHVLVLAVGIAVLQALAALGAARPGVVLGR